MTEEKENRIDKRIETQATNCVYIEALANVISKQIEDLEYETNQINNKEFVLLPDKKDFYVIKNLIWLLEDLAEQSKNELFTILEDYQGG